MKKQSSLLKDILQVVISVVIITFILLKFIIFPCEVDGKSMYPTLNDGDRCYSFIITRKIRIDRFDIAVIETSLDGEDRRLVKRVVGMPNDTIEYKNNQLYINGVEVEEEYLTNVHTEDLKITLGNDEYFCLGDNRDVSRDSRFYGPFKADQIVSTKIFVVFPFNRFGVKK